MANNKEKSGSITIANLIAIVGIVAFLILSYLGRSYMSGGEIGMDILISVIFTGVTAFLLWLMIKAKGAENDLKKWKIIEFSTVVAYIIFIVPSTIYGGALHFFAVNDSKDDIKQYAKDDLALIDNIFATYEDSIKTAINKTVDGLQHSIALNEQRSEDLKTYFEENNIETTKTSIGAYNDSKRLKLLGDNYKTLKKQYKDYKENINAVVDGWSIIQIPNSAKVIDELSEKIKIELNKLVENQTFPIIAYQNESRAFDIIESRQYAFDIQGELKFKDALMNTDGSSILAWVVVLLIHIVILFNYFVAYRTSVLSVRTKGDDGGIILDL